MRALFRHLTSSEESFINLTLQDALIFLHLYTSMTLGVQIFACIDSQQLQSPRERHKYLPKTNCFHSLASPCKEARRIIAVGVAFPTHIFFLTAKHIASGTIRNFFLVWALGLYIKYINIFLL